ncbi:MAP kinase phosphatase 6 [Thecamonas trahens ATCC 50062]|uniref:MAP kinase phosphatase 6 n=1 Tax=Thecamonas trahens ATCC 50062 TaxID=461836 RepID=A0A0L0DBD4_THETB|nr:MAP kinase phosphatase 6 [Thecamonas trahens ATCC 50062]KNC48593.1 MAP kinase phosphatase 6 [Thecamonas trahens ATCC 50062]|eukprot:XP_013762649.1 MAP kinase phosphatase 6 [Thecamonas trahens ATCC 50062]
MGDDGPAGTGAGALDESGVVGAGSTVTAGEAGEVAAAGESARKVRIPSKSALRGPTDYSNWLIPGTVLLGAYPGSLDDHVHREQLLAILQTGVTAFVCLQDEIDPYADPDAWRSGTAIRPYIDDARALLMEPELGLTQNDAAFLYFPIPDCGVADDADVQHFARHLHERVLAGDVLYIHCWGGHGRTGTIACILLALRYGLSAPQAEEWVQYAHDTRVYPQDMRSPQTAVQRLQVRRVIEALETAGGRGGSASTASERQRATGRPSTAPRKCVTFSDLSNQTFVIGEGKVSAGPGLRGSSASASLRRSRAVRAHLSKRNKSRRAAGGSARSGSEGGRQSRRARPSSAPSARTAPRPGFQFRASGSTFTQPSESALSLAVVGVKPRTTRPGSAGSVRGRRRAASASQRYAHVQAKALGDCADAVGTGVHRVVAHDDELDDVPRELDDEPEELDDELDDELDEEPSSAAQRRRVCPFALALALALLATEACPGLGLGL